MLIGYFPSSRPNTKVDEQLVDALPPLILEPIYR